MERKRSRFCRRFAGFGTWIGRCLYAAVLVSAAGPAAWAASLDVAVVLSSDSVPYVEMADGIREGVRQRKLGRVHTFSVDALGQSRPADGDVIVAVGLKAVQALAAADARVPTLNVLIPRVAAERVAKQRGDRGHPISAVYLDQPIPRQLDLIQAVLPGRKRIGVIAGPDSATQLSALRAETRARGLRLTLAQISHESELSSALQQVLADADVLLSLPDSVVFTSRTLQSVLFTAYRYQVPVIGFSPAYVRSGALAAVHSMPAQLAHQVVDILERLDPAAPSLPPPQYPVYFSVGVNEHVARSLEIAVEPADTLAAQLRTARDPTKP